MRIQTVQGDITKQKDVQVTVNGWHMMDSSHHLRKSKRWLFLDE